MKIIKIEQITSDSLRYDITVEDNHNFFANGILVHNCQNFITDFLKEYYDHTWEISLKLDGSSMTVYYNSADNDFGVCSRNLSLKDTESNTLWMVAKDNNLEEKMKSLGKSIAIQGELMGPGIQGNPERLCNHDLYVFNVWDITEQKYWNSTETQKLAAEFGLKHVPIYDTTKLNFKTADEFLELAENGYGGKSLNSDLREGLVFKSIEDPNVSFKAISNKFLLGEK
jgi:RNA ligase (TIGR02306 family)